MRLEITCNLEKVLFFVLILTGVTLSNLALSDEYDSVTAETKSMAPSVGGGRDMELSTTSETISQAEFWLPWEPSTPHWGTGQSEHVLVVATEDSKITYNGDPYVLAAGEYWRTPDSPWPEVGDHIELISGNIAVSYFWASNDYGIWEDRVLQYTLLPSTMYDTDYLVPLGGEVGVLAPHDGTTVTYFDGSTTDTRELNRGDHFTFSSLDGGRVSATQPITVVVGNCVTKLDNWAYAAFPTTYLGTEYYLHEDGPNNMPGKESLNRLLIMAPDAATVEVAGVPYTLSAGEVVALDNPTPFTKISSDHPVAPVYLHRIEFTDPGQPGSQRAATGAYALQPTSLWSTDFVTIYADLIHFIGLNTMKVEIDILADGSIDETHTLTPGANQLSWVRPNDPEHRGDRSWRRVQSTEPMSVVDAQQHVYGGQYVFTESLRAVLPLTIPPPITTPPETTTPPVTTTTSPDTWRIETVDIGGEWTSLALDGGGNPHISYASGGLKYARWTGAAWQTETVDTGVAKFTSLALDAGGNPHISYSDKTYLKYARWTGAAWQLETVDSLGADFVGQISEFVMWTSLALDTGGNPHISYYSHNVLKYARWTGAAWQIEIIDDVIYGISLALDAEDNPHIIYYANETLKYTRWTGTEWRIETVDASGYRNSLTVDAEGNPHISYLYRTSERKTGDLKYAKWTGVEWRFETIEEEVWPMDLSLALDAEGNPHISYHAHSGWPHWQVLKYAWWTGAAWQIETVDSDDIVGVGFYSSLALDTEGNPHISYYRSPVSKTDSEIIGEGTLKYATRAAPTTNRAPTVQVIQPNGGERIYGTYEIQWNANDPNGDVLLFTLSYSPNGGQTWTLLASELTEPSYTWDTSSVQAGENYLIKVDASDGRLAATDQSDAQFAIGSPLPELSVKGLVPSFSLIVVLGAILAIVGLGLHKRRLIG